eukprot:TRINITY_DN2512_c2_g1_i6.p1 TRINITY_DN2512_c2_g1~~TRINITY_DN2512_c2_g1_i6.p1  ORF type:complete len:181 (-),score=45.19 TRINITY_DN2512_c2_g1_i6:184-726(-)
MYRSAPRGHGSWGDHKWVLEPSHCSHIKKKEVVSHVEKGVNVHHTVHLTMEIPHRYGLMNIHDVVEDIVGTSGVEDGFCYVSAMHISAGVFVNDAEMGLLKDISRWLDKMCPYDLEGYEHHAHGEDNGDSHLKSFITNHSMTLPITKGQLDLGTWQQIFYMEGDGMRPKRFLVKVTGIGK